MVKTKFFAFAATAALTASLGLVACGGQQQAAETTASETQAEAGTEAASESATGTTTETAAETTPERGSDENPILTWDGVLNDGMTSVSYMNGVENGQEQAVLSIIPETGVDYKTVWLGNVTTAEDGKVTITDSETGNTVSYTVLETIPNVAMRINIDGYGEVTLYALTADEYATLFEVSQDLEDAAADAEVVDWQGGLVDGSSIAYIESKDGKNAAFSIMQKDSDKHLVWMGEKTTSDDGVVTITDADRQESISIRVTDVASGVSMKVYVDGYGVGSLVPFTIGDYKQMGAAAEATL